MATVICPHCHNELASCPYCGGAFANQNNVEMELQMDQPPRIKLGQPQRNLPLGLGGTVAGVFGLIGSLFIILTSSLGLLVLILSGLSIVGGSAMIIGSIITECPHCGKRIHLSPHSQRIICHHCRTICVRKDDYLEIL